MLQQLTLINKINGKDQNSTKGRNGLHKSDEYTNHLLSSLSNEAKSFDDIIDEAMKLNFLQEIDDIKKLPGKGRFIITFKSDLGKLEIFQRWKKLLQT